MFLFKFRKILVSWETFEIPLRIFIYFILNFYLKKKKYSKVSFFSKEKNYFLWWFFPLFFLFSIGKSWYTILKIFFQWIYFFPLTKKKQCEFFFRLFFPSFFHSLVFSYIFPCNENYWPISLILVIFFHLTSFLAQAIIRKFHHVNCDIYTLSWENLNFVCRKHESEYVYKHYLCFVD